jgi:hypothetical protein
MRKMTYDYRNQYRIFGEYYTPKRDEFGIPTEEIEKEIEKLEYFDEL